MEQGYLIIETHAEHPKMVRIRRADTPPETPGVGDRTNPRVRYIARFGDASAAQMQTHAGLRHYLVDADTSLYRCDPAIAAAAAQTLELRHSEIYLDPELAASTAFSKAAAKHRSRHRLADRLWQVVGILAVVFLLVKLLFGF